MESGFDRKRGRQSSRTKSLMQRNVNMRCLACDFGGSSLKYAIIDHNAQIAESGKQPAPLVSVEEFVEAVGGLYDRYRNEIDGLALSLPGYIDAEKGTLAGSGVYSALYHRNIFSLLEKRCPIPTTLENDGKCAALAEAWKGALQNCVDGAVIILGSGIAGGIIKNGKVHTGKNFTAGELSYIIVDPSANRDLKFAFMSAAAIGLTYRTCKAKNIDLSAQDASNMLREIDHRVELPYGDAGYGI